MIHRFEIAFENTALLCKNREQVGKASRLFITSNQSSIDRKVELSGRDISVSSNNNKYKMQKKKSPELGDRVEALRILFALLIKMVT